MRKISLTLILISIVTSINGQTVDETNGNIHGFNRIQTGTGDWMDIQLIGAGSLFQIRDQTNYQYFVTWTAGSSYTDFKKDIRVNANIFADSGSRSIYGFNRIQTGSAAGSWLDIQLMGTGSVFKIHDQTNGQSFAKWTAGSTYTDFVKDVVISNGRLGIGNTTPSAFDGWANQIVSGNGNGHQGITIHSSSALGGHLFFADGAGGAADQMGRISYLHSSDQLQFWTNNSQKMTINSSGNVGIGTSSPSANLEVKDPTDATLLTVIENNSTTRRRINLGAKNDEVYIQHLYGTSGVPFNFKVSETNVMTLSGSNVGIGTTTPQSKLAVEGQIRATEVKVLADISVPDYVFEPGYELRTLKETKEYVEENRHLPEIPSAAEIGENGIDLGDMNMRLLKKIEELTLYQIELLERLEKLEKENARIDELEEKITKLENK